MKLKSEIKSIMDEYKFSGPRGVLTLIICLFSSAYFLYTAYKGPFPSFIQRSMLLLVCTTVIFLSKPFLEKDNKLTFAIDLLLVAASLAGFIYTIIARDHLHIYAGMPFKSDYVFGIMCLFCVVEATRRKVGKALPIMVIVFVLYGIFGKYLPGLLQHRGMSLKAFVTALYMSEDGIFGQPATAAANFVMAFILFGAFLSISGAGQAFTDIAISGFGSMRGGPAKAAVVSSALMGMVSGSAVANVVTTGTFTIPLMKKSGYDPASAGAVEAVASTGGQIMPPVMGAAAFIMADTLGIPYWNVVKAAFVPAFLYYVALFFMVDFQAAKSKLLGIPRDQLPDIRKLFLTNGYLLLPIVSLVYFLGVVRISAQKSVFYTILVIIVISMFRKETRVTPRKFVKALIDGAMGGLEVGVVCGCAGIVIGIILRSGLGMSLTNILIQIAGGRLIVLMILTMITSIILGMGLPTSACYIIVAVLIAPAMIKLGVAPLAAHMFAFYYGCLSAITPPVALASYAGASLAGANQMTTGWKAVRFGLCGFIVPFMFVSGNELLLMGPLPGVILACATSIVGTYFLSVGLMGYQFTHVAWVFRVIYFICALLMILPGWATDLPGLAVGVVLSIINFGISRKQKTSAVAA
ncbi:TRAP transporter permease [Treponema primitia]|uniref:TRAP transporter permease n=1 Tax=Treponema primitia TaxID=88058 RepID=UPI0039800679